MGTHAGCILGSCHQLRIRVAALPQLVGFRGFSRPRLGVSFAFAVGINQIELGNHGSQNYQFFPEVRRIEHAFNNITASTYRRGLFHAIAGLNPEAGRSTTRFESIDQEQPGFFPAHQHLRLFLQFTIDSPVLGFFGRRRIQIFNPIPLVYRTEIPLTGFPPVNGPDFVLQESVDFVDAENPSLSPLFQYPAGARISPINRVIYSVSNSAVISTNGRDFHFDVTVSLLEPGSLRTAIALIPSRGVSIATPVLQHLSLRDPMSFTVRGRVEDPAEEHLEVTVRPYSEDPSRMGSARHDVPLPGHGHLHALDLAEPAAIVARAGERVVLSAVPVALAAALREHIWVCPHGVEHDETSGGTFGFTAPKVSEPTDMWVTCYVRESGETSRPHKFEVLVEPE